MVFYGQRENKNIENIQKYLIIIYPIFAKMFNELVLHTCVLIIEVHLYAQSHKLSAIRLYIVVTILNV